MSVEAELTSHLSISYSVAPTAGGTPAAASGTPASANTSPAALGDGMAAFLAALVDHLPAGAATSGARPAAATADDATAAPAPVPFGTAIDPAALTMVQSSVPRGNLLLKQLTQGLQTLQDQLDKGEAPDPDLLKRLGGLADAIAAMINVPATPAAAPPVDPAAALDPLAALGQSSDKPKTDPLAGLADTSPAPRQSTVPDNVAQFLASLGLRPPAVPAAVDPNAAADQTSVATAAPSQPLPGIAQLVDRLAALTQPMAAASPELAQKLEALGQKLAAAEATPQALAQLTAGSDADATGLDTLVQSLLAAKPTSPGPTTPTLAAKTDLPMPAPIVRTDAQLAAPQSPPALAASGSIATAGKTTLVSKPGDAASGDVPKAETQAGAAATAKVDPKAADGNGDPTAQQPSATAVATAQAAPAPRTIPAVYQAASSPINMGQVAFEMVRQVHQGTSRFSFRIDPPELGRVDVRMHVDASGTVNARLTVERSETLDMFQRDRGALEKALTQAGLDSGKTSLEFSLKQNQQNPFAGLAGGDQRPSGSNAAPQFSLAGTDDGEAVPAVPSITLYRGIASAGGVNLFV